MKSTEARAVVGNGPDSGRRGQPEGNGAPEKSVYVKCLGAGCHKAMVVGLGGPNDRGTESDCPECHRCYDCAGEVPCSICCEPAR